MKKISIIIPIFNEEDAIGITLERLNKVLIEESKNYIFEILLLDNCSTDNSYATALELQKSYKNMTVIKQSRNFGYQANILAGYENATGDAVVQLDADGEDDPILISKFLRKWEEGYDVVYGIRKKRYENFIISLIRKIFYRFINFVSDIDLPIDAGDFRLLDKKIVKNLDKFKETSLYIMGIVSYIGFKQCGIEYDRSKRNSGSGKISILNYFKIATKGIVSFSAFPLYFIFILGLLVFGVSIVLIISYILLFYLNIVTEPGFTTLVLFILCFFGIIIFSIGIIAIYIGMILDEIKARPRYLIDKKKNT